MSRINLKKDYEDGQVLYGDELNVNNEVTELGVNDNYDKIQELTTNKANLSYVDGKLASKADADATNNAISLLNAQKASKTDLAKKADVTALDLKADITYVNTALLNKADRSDVNYILTTVMDLETRTINPLIEAVGTLHDDMGDLDNLRTSDKSSLVNAINSIQTAVIPIATTSRAGLVKPDGTTITVDQDGTIHSVGGGGGSGTSDYNLLQNKPTINEVELRGNLSLNDLGLYSKSEISSLLSGKANLNDVVTISQYTSLIKPDIDSKAEKTYVDTELTTKADKSTTYTKTQVDDLLDAADDVTDAKLTAKADKSTTYTKTDVDNAVGAKADGLSFSNNQLQLKSGNNLIGTPVEITVGSDDVAIQPTQPTNRDNKLWVDTSDNEGVIPVASEVVDSLEGTRNDKAPSVRAVKEAFQTKGQVLWTNPNPTSPFTGQTITLSNNDYDYIDIIFNNYINRDTYTTVRIYNISGNFEIDVLFNYQGSVYVGSRYAQFTDNGNKIAFEVAFGKEAGTSGNVTEQSSWAVPYKIIGYKY